MLYARGMGEEVSSVFDHALVPERATARSVYLRLVDTLQEAKNYAINAFHTSVIRGSAGGCKDPVWAEGAAQPFANGGIDTSAVCQWPINRQDIRDAWAAKARAYLNAVESIRAGQNWRTVKDVLIAANAIQPSPYMLENVDPPYDPGPPEAPVPIPEPVAAGPKRSRWKIAAMAVFIGLGLVGVIGVAESRRMEKRRR
jgi:hypothetical protein